MIPRRLGRRMVLSLALVVGLLSCLMVLYHRSIVQPRIRAGVLRDVLQLLEQEGALARCDADPAAFVVEVGKLGTITAVEHPGRGRHRLRIELDRPGACRHFQLSWDRWWIGLSPEELLADVIIRMAFAACMLGAAFLVVIVPVVRRIQTMASETHEVVARDFEGELPRRGDDELEALAVAFNHATRAARERLDLLQERDRRTREMLADLVHDLRTPMAALQLAVRRLGDGHPDPAAVREAMGEVHYLDALVGNLRSWVELRGTSPSEIRVPLDGRDLAERVVLRFAGLARDRGVEVVASTGDRPLPLEADPVGLEQALSNLVHNAVDFAGANVAVLAYAEGEEVVFDIRDDGPGLASAEIPLLSERSFRGAENRARGREGQGLGLAIAAEVARRHQGRIELSPYPEGGTRAVLRLPRRSQGG